MRAIWKFVLCVDKHQYIGTYQSPGNLVFHVFEILSDG